jgi:hypothetical protein
MLFLLLVENFVAVSCDQLDLLFCFIDGNDSEQKYGYQRQDIRIPYEIALIIISRTTRHTIFTAFLIL